MTAQKRARPGAAGDEAPDFVRVERELEDDDQLLTGRIAQLQEQRLTLADRVLRGLATREELSAVTTAQHEAERERADVRTQLEAARRGAVKQREAEAREASEREVDELAEAYARAQVLAARIDAKIAELAPLVADCRAALDRSALDVDFDSPFERRLRLFDRQDKLHDEILYRLRIARVVVLGADAEHLGRDHPARRLSLQEWVRGWSARVVTIAREHRA